MPVIAYDNQYNTVRLDGFDHGAIEIWPALDYHAFRVRFTTSEGGHWTPVVVAPWDEAFPKIQAIHALVKEKAPSFHQGPRHTSYLAS